MNLQDIQLVKSYVDVDFADLKIGYRGTKVFVTDESRACLPYLHPVDLKVPIWKIISKFIKQDLTKVSLPVQLSEPTSSLQRSCEIMQDYALLETASQNDDSCYRLAMTAIFSLTTLAYSAQRLKKPFNPILGETYEFAHEKFRFISEQVSHHPPITAFHFEGNGYQG